MKDRYRHWHESSPSVREAARIFRAPGIRDLEDLVLQDLAKAKTESEKLEILDSYSLACQRQYRNSMYEAIIDIGQRLLVGSLGPILKINLPDPQPPYHPNVGVATSPEPMEV